ncbi:hypothetical protein AT05_05440 [Schleiferia thermophila str. Yellowstone]|nr:hypothetical protein AT05_05440 [Schleiferia thermophila str. Yellowstone]
MSIFLNLQLSENGLQSNKFFHNLSNVYNCQKA